LTAAKSLLEVLQRQIFRTLQEIRGDLHPDRQREKLSWDFSVQCSTKDTLCGQCAATFRDYVNKLAVEQIGYQ
jgi:hypothetical protein